MVEWSEGERVGWRTHWRTTGMRVVSNRSFRGQDKNVPLCLLGARNLDPHPWERGHGLRAGDSMSPTVRRAMGPRQRVNNVRSASVMATGGEGTTGNRTGTSTLGGLQRQTTDQQIEIRF